MRKTRIIKNGAEYHVIGRINRKEMLLKNESVKALFISIVERAKKKYKFYIRNFCIMDNHIHMIIKPLKGQSLSRIMQWILGVFAATYNRLYNKVGHVWYDRFKSKIITNYRQYIATFNYISKNPVKAGIVVGQMPHIELFSMSITFVDRKI